MGVNIYGITRAEHRPSGEPRPSGETLRLSRRYVTTLSWRFAPDFTSRFATLPFCNSPVLLLKLRAAQYVLPPYDIGV